MTAATIIFCVLLIIFAIQTIALTICGRMLYLNLKHKTKSYKLIIIALACFIVSGQVSDWIMAIPL